ncbi:hypothetical protein THIOKS12580057 [Thiocapsa sp. KS1]|nr:hypothetical protein THIOKS12580057 [Thiocapsa sp. KS1]
MRFMPAPLFGSRYSRIVPQSLAIALLAVPARTGHALRQRIHVRSTGPRRLLNRHQAPTG